MIVACFINIQAIFSQTDTISIEKIAVQNSLKNAPVIPFQDTLFYINTNMGSFSAEERATSISNKIRKVSEENSFHHDSVLVVVSGNIMEIVFRNIVIMSITPADAYAKGESQLGLANNYKKIIGKAIVEHEKSTDWMYILIQVALVVLVILIMFFLIKLLNIQFKKISTKIEEQKGKKIKPIKLKSYNLLDEEKSTKVILFVFKIIRYLAIGILLYLAIPIIFSIFPYTRDFADKLFGYILNPVQKILKGIIGYIPNLITIIVIIFAFHYLIKGLRYLAEEIDKEHLTIKGFYPDWAFPSFNIIKTLLYAFMFIIIFPYLPGSDSDVFKGVSVFLGIIFSLGSTSIISNIVSGLVLTYMRPFRVGDRIKIGDLVGNVIEKTPFVTRVRTPKNEEVTVPNSNIMSAETFNYSHSARVHGLILHTEVTIGYDAPWRQVHQLLTEAAARTSDVMKEPKPFVLQTALNDFYVEYQINIYIEDADKTAFIYSELNQHIQDTFNEGGVEIMSPHYNAHRDGNQTTIPENYLPGNYQTPSFNIKVTNT